MRKHGPHVLKRVALVDVHGVRRVGHLLVGASVVGVRRARTRWSVLGPASLVFGSGVGVVRLLRRRRWQRVYGAAKRRIRMRGARQHSVWKNANVKLAHVAGASPIERAAGAFRRRAVGRASQPVEQAGRTPKKARSLRCAGHWRRASAHSVTTATHSSTVVVVVAHFGLWLFDHWQPAKKESWQMSWVAFSTIRRVRVAMLW